jgi:ArsR family transcriptional regulator
VRPFLDALKALADLNRLRILLALRDRPLCVCQIVALLELAPSTVSKHLAILDQAGFIQAQKEGRWIFYRRTGRKGPVEVRWLTALVDRLASACPQAVKDRKRLAKLLQTQREVLCSRYYSPKARTVSSS